MAITRLGPNQDITAAKIAGQINFKNLIINGDFAVAQRATSATGLTNGSSPYQTVDRWQFNEFGAPSFQFTMSQSTTVPTGQGFGYSTKFDCTTAQGSLAADDQLAFRTALEGQMLQSIKKGTSNAESLSLSFWVRSNKTGTYTIFLNETDNNRQNTQTYTISSADTWEKKTITFAPDTTGTINNDNGSSLYLHFMLAAGSTYSSGTFTSNTWGATTAANRVPISQVNLADSTSNEWYITGVQLEVGTAASDFEFLPYDVNFKRCQRYFESSCAPLQNPSDGISSVGIIDQAGAHPIYQPMVFNTSKRAVPTMTYYNGSSGSTGTWRTNAGTDVSVSSYSIKIQGFTINCADLGAEGRSANGSWEADAEL